MTVESVPVMNQDSNLVQLGKPQDDCFRVRMPISLSVPFAESKSGMLKSYTAYCIKVCFRECNCHACF